MHSNTTHPNSSRTSKSTAYDVIVLGAGAAGLMAGATAGQRGRRVLVLDHSAKLAEKIRISGGGRCNFTNLNIRPECYLSSNPHFCRSALAQYTQHDFIALVNKHRIAWHEKTLGQLFCDGSSQQIIDMLDQECRVAGVTRIMQAGISQVHHKGEGGNACFVVETTRGNFNSQSLIVATGGLAVPQIGATPFGYQLAEQFGLPMVAPTPALVPLTWHQQDRERFVPLAGISLDVEVSVGKATFREHILFTHKGLSGPAILQISSYWTPGQPIMLNLLPREDALAMLQAHTSSDKKLATILTERGWPRRFTDIWLEAQEVPDVRVRELSAKKLQQIAQAIQQWSLLPNGTQGYKLAEVTQGGVDTRALDSKTMGAKALPGLFFAGEVIDVTGWLGGYNFQWAWSSGYVAGMNA